jgi:preprotein translocase subunit SecG
MFTFLLILQTIIAVVMISVILMQRSEGGGFAGGSPSGLMTARGAADFLTRATSITATMFVVLSIVLAALAAGERAPRTIDPNLAKQGAPAVPAGAPVEKQTSPFTPNPAEAPKAQPPAQADNGTVPLAQ